MSYLDVPPKASMLYALEVPPSGGNTSFCTMYGIYEALPQMLKDRVAGLNIKHDGTYNSGGYVRQGVTPTDPPDPRKPRVRRRRSHRAAASAAKPRSRSPIRSSTSSSPMCRRTVGPPGAHVVAVRMLLQSNGMAKLSKPPHDAPMPNRLSSFKNALTALCATGLNTMLNSPLAPEKSRRQMAWPGQLSSAGWSTRAISGRAASQRATFSPA